MEALYMVEAVVVADAGAVDIDTFHIINTFITECKDIILTILHLYYCIVINTINHIPK